MQEAGIHAPPPWTSSTVSRRLIPVAFANYQRAFAIGRAAVDVGPGQALVESFATDFDLDAATAGVTNICANGVKCAVECEHARVVKPGLQVVLKQG